MYIYENLIQIIYSFLERNVKLQHLSLVEKTLTLFPMDIFGMFGESPPWSLVILVLKG